MAYLRQNLKDGDILHGENLKAIEDELVSLDTDNEQLKVEKSEKLAQLQAADSAEEQARKAEDAALSGKITAEAQTRASADTALGARIDTETTNRAKADSELQSAIEQEAQTRALKDDALQTAVDHYASAEKTLTEAIHDEALARAAADQNLDSKIENTKTELQQSISAVQSDVRNHIGNVSSERAALETETNDRIDSIESTVSEQYRIAMNSVLSETMSRREADRALEQRIDTLSDDLTDAKEEEKEDIAETAQRITELRNELAGRVGVIEETIEDLSIDVTEAGAVAYSKPQNLTEEQQARARENIGAPSASDIESAIQAVRDDLEDISVDPSDIGAIAFDKAQTLTDAQKTTARQNMGLGDINQLTSGNVKYESEQNLTEQQKKRARDNISAASSGDIDKLSTDMSKYNGAVTGVEKNANGLVVSYVQGDPKTVMLSEGKNLHLYNDTENHLLYLMDDNDVAQGDPVLITGGGGGGGGGGTASITRIGDNAASVEAILGNAVGLAFKLTAKDSSGDEVSGSTTARWYVNSVQVATSTVMYNREYSGADAFDITQYLSSGVNNISVSMSVPIDAETTLPASKTWVVNLVNLYFDWDFNRDGIHSGSFQDTFTAYGNVPKKMHLAIDGVEQEPIAIDNSGVEQRVIIPALSHGVHSLERWLTATIGGTDKETPHQYHETVCTEDGNTTPIVAIGAKAIVMNQYDTFQIPVLVYDPLSLTADARLLVDGEKVADWTKRDRTTHSWNFTPATDGTKTLRVECVRNGVTEAYREINATVAAVTLNVKEVEGYDFRFKVSEFATNDAVRAWASNGITASFSENFDWVNGGIQTELDENDQIRQAFVIKAGTSMEINKKLFSRAAEDYGFDLKIIFKVMNCREYDAEWAHCYGNERGIRMYAHSAELRSAAEHMSTLYEEDAYTELEMEIYKKDKGTEYPKNYMMAWLDGVPTNVKIYTDTDSFVQSAAAQENLVIGSPDCDVALYMVKMYQQSIPMQYHVDNFIMDAPNAAEMITRHNRNDILDEETQEIDYTKLAARNPDLRIYLYDIPYMTMNKIKKDPVPGCKFQQIWMSGDKYYQITGVCTMGIQGTSSYNYRKGCANTDSKFTELTDGNGVDLLAGGVQDDKSPYGNNWYFADEQDPAQVKIFTLAEAYEKAAIDADKPLGPEWICVERDQDRNPTRYILALGFKVNDDSCPITYSNIKVNYASCEQVNNYCNAIWYQRYQPYQSMTPRDCMEFSLGAQFVKETGVIPGDGEHIVLFDDKQDKTKYYFYSIANMGTSKNNVHVFHDLSNPKEMCVEIKDNTKLPCRFLAYDDGPIDWDEAPYFESRYPPTKTPGDTLENAWKRLWKWLYDSNPASATGAALPSAVTFGEYTFKGHQRPGLQVLRGTKVKQYAGTYTHDTFEYRMAKMLSECEDYLVMDSIVYHYLFIERHTAVDNVAKNCFVSTDDLIHWDMSKAYDMDTSDGNNNEGVMSFDYGCEYGSTTSTGKEVFNASDSVWFVFIANLHEARKTMFLNREAAGAWSATAYHKFLTDEQKKVPERCWVQCYWFDYLRTYEKHIEGVENRVSYLDGGTKQHQRQHYETFQEIYMSGKYNGSAAAAQTVVMRGYSPDNWAGVKPKGAISMKMYNTMYAIVDIDGTPYIQKINKGEMVTIDFDDVKLNDTVIKLYPAGMIQELGDMSALYGGDYSFGAARRLRSLSLGSAIEGYANYNFFDLKLSGNTMLEYLYVQNLKNGEKHQVGSLDLSSCPALLVVDATGSDFTGIAFAQNGLVHTALLNAPTTLSMRDLAHLEDADPSAQDKKGLYIADLSKLTLARIENSSAYDSRIDETTGVNELAIIKRASSLITARVLGIHWANEVTTEILDRIYGMTGINDDGTSADRAVLSGYVYVPNITQRQYDNYMAAWPNLEVEFGNKVLQFRVDFVNADGSPIKDRQGNDYYQYVNQGEYPYNPVMAGEISAPTLPEDEQYKYTYDPADGWDGLTTPVIREGQKVTAKYIETIQQYRVRYYLMQGGELLKTYTVEYGQSCVFSETGEIPTYTAREENYLFYTWMGWDKSTGFIRSNLDIYGLWSIGSLPEGKELKDMTPGEMMAVRQTDTASTYMEEMDYFEFEMGHDFDFLNVQGQLLAKDKFFDGTVDAPEDISIQLFGENEENFTVAIDYEFIDSTINNTLVSLSFDEDEAQGVRLRYSSNPNIQWGNSNMAVGQTFRRNVVVLRHQKGSRTLSVYAFNQEAAANVYSDEIVYNVIGRNKETKTDAVISLGGVKVSDGYVDRGVGWIHWAKIWMDDLGDENARMLAAWPHEKWKAQYYGQNLYRLKDRSAQKCAASFIMAGITDQGHRHRTTNVNEGGWPKSDNRAFCNERIYPGFPTWLQSLIRTVTVYSSAGDKTTTEFVWSNDNVYLASYREISGSTGAPYGDEAETRIPWFVENNGVTANATRIKFRGLTLRDDVRYIFNQTDPTIIYNDIKEGDVWVNTSNSSNGYYYVPKETRAKHKFIGVDLTSTSNIEADDGGLWIIASYWWGRSPNASNTTSFMSVYTYGTPGYVNNASHTYALDPCFSF